VTAVWPDRSRRIYPPRILDAAALVSLIDGTLDVLSMLDDAYARRVFLLMPAVALAEAEAAVRVGSRMWEPFLRFPGTRTLELTEHTAIESGRLMDLLPLMIAQVIYEARAMGAVVVTQTPEAYDGLNVAVMAV
jgi:hypothetical protein